MSTQSALEFEYALKSNADAQPDSQASENQKASERIQR